MLGSTIMDFFRLMFGIVPKEPEPEPLPKIQKLGKFLHGFDLDQWNYLGNSEIWYNVPKTEGDNKNGVKYSANVFFFVNKLDENHREYVIKTANNNFDYTGHPWITTIADTWRAGLTEHYRCINKEPSSYLKDRVRKEHNWVWVIKTSWWSEPTANEKYEEAAKKQKVKTTRKRKAKVVTEEANNVIKLEFPKETE
jgi:hypothetical protein